MITFRLTFALDTDTGHYVVESCPPGFNRCPRELVVEEKRFNDGIKADLLLRGSQTAKKTNGRSYQFFTGLQPTHLPNTYLGNILTFGRDSKRIRNAVVVRFAADAGRFTLWYVPGQYPYPDHRQTFVTEALLSHV